MLPTEDKLNFDAALFHEGDEALLRLLEDNWHTIRTHYHIGRPTQDVYCFRLDPEEYFVTQGFENIKTVIESLQFISKINASFSVVLRHKKTGEYRFFHASGNNQIFKNSLIVDPGTVPEALKNQYYALNLEETLVLADNTKFVFECVPSQTVYVMKIRDETGV